MSVHRGGGTPVSGPRSIPNLWPSGHMSFLGGGIPQSQLGGHVISRLVFTSSVLDGNAGLTVPAGGLLSKLGGTLDYGTTWLGLRYPQLRLRYSLPPLGLGFVPLAGTRVLPPARTSHEQDTLRLVRLLCFQPEGLFNDFFFLSNLFILICEHAFRRKSTAVRDPGVEYIQYFILNNITELKEGQCCCS